MSNKMKKIILIFALAGLFCSAFGFAPKRRDFASEYQYRLYKSWLARESTERDLPAKITTHSVKRELLFRETGKAKVVYIWDNWKIIRQYENLPSELPFSDYETELRIAGELLYRLNCRHPNFARDYLKFLQVTITYRGLSSEYALDSLFAHYPNRRVIIRDLHPVLNKDDLTQLILELENSDELIIIFNDMSKYPTAILKLKEHENNIDPALLPNDFGWYRDETATYLPPRKPKEKEIIPEEKPKEKIIPDKDVISDTLLTDYETKLINWIEKHQNSSFGNEMLNNKISDIKSFLQDEFVEHSLLIKGDNYNLNHSLFSGNLNSNLYLEITENRGWEIKATDDITIKGKKVSIAGFEQIDMSNLEKYDVEIISSFLPQILMSHRVMASRLAGFLLERDIAETTLVIHSSVRKVYELDSYRDLLMMMGRFWENRNIYYNISEFKLVDGYIEFKGYLAAEDRDTKEYDLAEIRYRLDDDYTIVLAMVVIFPDQRPKTPQGR